MIPIPHQIVLAGLLKICPHWIVILTGFCCAYQIWIVCESSSLDCHPHQIVVPAWVPILFWDPFSLWGIPWSHANTQGFLGPMPTLKGSRPGSLVGPTTKLRGPGLGLGGPCGLGVVVWCVWLMTIFSSFSDYATSHHCSQSKQGHLSGPSCNCWKGKQEFECKADPKQGPESQSQYQNYKAHSTPHLVPSRTTCNALTCINMH